MSILRIKSYLFDKAVNSSIHKVFINNLFLSLVFTGVIVFLPSDLYPESYFWRSKSGVWKIHKLESGNQVLRQDFKYDRAKLKVPTPFLMFRTIQLKNKKKDGKEYNPQNISKIKFLFNVNSFYSKNSEGEASIFLTGENEKSLYYIQFLFNKTWFYKVSLYKSDIVDPKLPMRVFGNFKVTELAYTKINFPSVCRKEVYIEITPIGMRLFLNDRLVLSYINTPKTRWISFPKSFFAIGFRGATSWIDNIEVHAFQDKTERLIFKDNFSSSTIKRIRIK